MGVFGVFAVMLGRRHYSSVIPITERMDMGLYEVFLSMSLLGFGMGCMIILLFNVMEVLSVGGGALLNRPCMIFQRLGGCSCDPSVHEDVLSIGFVYV